MWGKCPSPHPLLDASGVAASSPCRLAGSGRCKGQVREVTQSRDPRAACQPCQPQEVPARPAACGPAHPTPTGRMGSTLRRKRREKVKEPARDRERHLERQRDGQRGRCREKSSWGKGSQVVGLLSSRAEGVGPGCQLSNALCTHWLCLTQSRAPQP